jgi:hypothetical protein
MLLFIMAFTYGTKLANLQDSIFEKISKGEAVTAEEESLIKNNLWIIFAEMLAPSNLVVRNYILYELINHQKNKPVNIERQRIIYKLCQRLLRKGCLWQEGYSYWLYTKPFLQAYVYLSSGDLSIIVWLEMSIRGCDDAFLKLSYSRDGVLYPPPFGDLRDQPLEPDLQDKSPEKKFSAFPVALDGYRYFIHKNPLGLNLHTSYKDRVYIIKDGRPIRPRDGREFSWYTGYKNKYPTFLHELKDMLSLPRLLSLLNK